MLLVSCTSLFPFMIQRDWFWEWLLITLLVVLLGALSIKEQKQNTKQIDEVHYIQRENAEVSTVNSSIETEKIDSSNLGLEDLINRGFRAKEQGNYSEASQWFLRVLESNPTPDIQVYIVMDIFEFWDNMGKGTQGRSLVLDFNYQFFNHLPEGLQNRFKAWMDKHQIA